MPKVVVLDDEPFLRNSIGKFLSFNGFEVVVLAPVENIVDQILEIKPDMLITDLMMAPVTGKQIIKALRDSGEFDGKFILVLSGIDSSQEEAILNLGANMLIQKPFLAKDLVETVKKFFE